MCTTSTVETTEQLKNRVYSAVDPTSYNIYRPADFEIILKELEGLGRSGHVNITHIQAFGKFFNNLRKKVKSSHPSIAKRLRLLIQEWQELAKAPPPPVAAPPPRQSKKSKAASSGAGSGGDVAALAKKSKARRRVTKNRSKRGCFSGFLGF